MTKSPVSKIILFLSFFISFAANAQYYDSTHIAQKEKERKAEEAEDSFWKKTFFGGGLGLSFGNPTYVDVSPILGYRINEKVHAGVGVNYQYYEYDYGSYRFTTNIYGGSVFGRYYIKKDFFTHGEIEYLNLAAYNNIEKRIGVTSVLVGGGYIQRFSQYSGIVAMVLYNLTQNDYSPYASPLIIRLGVNIGL
ncbi:MAG: hypothetical protein WCP52_11985 [Bacteroidota bacterium]